MKKKVIESEVEFAGFDDKKARAYIEINKNDVKDLEEIKHLLPIRKSKSGTTPTMASIVSKWEPENQWVFPDRE